MPHSVLPLKALTIEDFAPFGWALGVVSPGTAPPSGASTFTSPGSDFWREHLFDTGNGAPAEVLWVAYRNDSREVSQLEKHLYTQQALMPLNGELAQVVARSGADGLPDLATLTAFRVLQGQGLCMAPHCWHATRVLRPAEVRCVMLTCPSTTLDLVRALHDGSAPAESAFATIVPHRWQA